jgi:hypothetical protein
MGDDELGVASAAADRTDPLGNRLLVLLRTGLDGDLEGTPLQVPVDGDVSMPSIAWDGEAYGIAYAVGRGEEADVELVRLGCQMP